MTRDSSRRLYAVGTGLLLLTLALGLAQGQGWFQPVDPPLMRWVGGARQSDVGSILTPIMVALTQIGDTPGRTVLLLIAATILCLRRRFDLAFWLFVVTWAITLLNSGVKQLFRAARPDLLQHLDAVTSYSFPSGHASGNLVFFSALALLVGRWPAWAIALPVAIAIGLSRLWLGVHWPSDILAGWVEGTGLLCLAYPSLLRLKGQGAPKGEMS